MVDNILDLMKCINLSPRIQKFHEQINKTTSTLYMIERLKNSTDQGKTLEVTKKKCCKQRKKKQRRIFIIGRWLIYEMLLINQKKFNRKNINMQWSRTV